jgi:hypothetical protein
MRTEHDLRQALVALEPDRVDLVGLLDRVEVAAGRRRRARRAGTVAAAAVALTAVAAVPVAVARHTPAGPTSAVAPALAGARPATPARLGTPLRFSFAVGAVPGYAITPGWIRPEAQTAAVALDLGAPKDIGDLTVYAAGRYDPTPATAGIPVEVNGHRGFYAAVVDPNTVSDGYRGATKPAVVWEYAAGAWAVVQGDWSPGAALAEELRVARAVRFDRQSTFAVPYRLGYLPAGLHAYGGLQNTTFWAWISLVQFADGAPATADSPAGGALVLDVRAGSLLSGAKAPIRTGTVVGRPARADEYGLIVDFGEYTVSLSVDAAHRTAYPPAVLTKIVAGMRWASAVGKPATWFDALAAVPQR